MRLLLIELHGLDFSVIQNSNLTKYIRPIQVFQSYAGHGSSLTFWTGLDEYNNDCYDKHYYNGTSGLFDLNIFRILRGDLYLSKSSNLKFRMSRTKHYFQDCDIFKKYSYSFSERPFIATSSGIYLDFNKDDVVRLARFRKHCNYDLNYIRLNTADYLGHKYGPNSLEVKSYLKTIIPEIVRLIAAFNGKTLVYSLYGMEVPIYKIDVLGYLRALKDLVFFVDDKNVRLWNAGNVESVQKAIEYLDGLNCGQWLSKKPNAKFGNYFYRAKPGVAFVPNNYVRKDLNGIHTSEGWIMGEIKPIYNINMIKEGLISLLNG